jgi:hypothetical protein
VSDAQDAVRTLFSAPGHLGPDRDGLLGPAAAAHASLLVRAYAHAGPAVADAFAPLVTYLAGPAPRAEKRRLLCHPLLVEGLHALAPFSADLKDWHDRVTSCRNEPPICPTAKAALGAVVLAVRLHKDRTWCGTVALCTDVLGRLGFPFTDWTVLLTDDRGDPLTSRSVSLTLTNDRAEWRIDGPDHPFLVTPRADCVRMLADDDVTVDARAWVYPDPAVVPHVSHACRLGQSCVRYDPVGIAAGTGHAGTTGGLVARVLAAIRKASPGVWREFRTYVRTVRGFEFPRASAVASFSDPTLPGVMSVSVSYTDADEPCLDPFAFMWFGHEMGHTKDYLCDTILYARGESLVTNPAEWSGVIPRYGRPLAVRTIIQVPYVHLYEWDLLMDFCEAHFRGLPWEVNGGAAAVGDDCAAEIAEAFDLIGEYADLTPVGVAAVNHFRKLTDDAADRWHRVRTLA